MSTINLLIPSSLTNQYYLGYRLLADDVNYKLGYDRLYEMSIYNIQLYTSVDGSGENIASQYTMVDASSTRSVHIPTKAIDDSFSSYWSTEELIMEPQWFSIMFAENIGIGSMRIRFRNKFMPKIAKWQGTATLDNNWITITTINFEDTTDCQLITNIGI